jgi:hypothetical protein
MKMNILSLILVIFISLPTFAECGLIGSVKERLESCSKYNSGRTQGFQVISVTSNGEYLFDAKTDIIISPVLKKTSRKKCLKPYRKLTPLENQLGDIPKLDKIPKDSFRCILRKSSQYILLENETSI